MQVGLWMTRSPVSDSMIRVLVHYISNKILVAAQMGGCTALRDKQHTQINALISDERLVAVYQMNFSALKKDTLERSWIFGKKFTTKLLLSATNK